MQRIMFRKSLFILILLSVPFVFFAQQQTGSERDRADLLLKTSTIDENAKAEVLFDEYSYKLKSNFTISLTRKIRIKFYKVDKPTLNTVANYFFSFNRPFKEYIKPIVTHTSLSETSKDAVIRDWTYFVNTTDASTWPINKLNDGDILDIEYFIEYPYNLPIDKIYLRYSLPIQKLDINCTFPELLTYTLNFPAGIKPDNSISNNFNGNFEIDGLPQPMKSSTQKYSFSFLPAAVSYPYLRSIKDNYVTAALQLTSLKRRPEQKIPEKLSVVATGSIVNYFNERTDFLGKMKEEIHIPSDYESRIAYIQKEKDKAFRIFDLVRRHFTWNGKDTISINLQKSLSRIWDEKKANSTEINMILYKLLQKNGIETYPVVISTRNNGLIDFKNTKPADFNRTIVKIVLKNGSEYFLDAVTKYGDAPLLSYQSAGVNGVTINSKSDFNEDFITDSNSYKEEVVLLGNIINDSSMLTQTYVNSFGYAKADKVQRLREDSLKKFINFYFIAPYKPQQFKHFIAANEFIDSLPLVQEFDFVIPLKKESNLYEINLNWFVPNDSIYTITATQPNADFGYNQNYSLMGKFAFPEQYEVYLLPTNVHFSAFGGDFEFKRELHKSSNSISLKYNFIFKRAKFEGEDATELANILQKIKSLMQQNIILRKIY